MSHAVTLPKVLLFWRDPCRGGTCSGASSSQYSVARRWHGRFRCMRSRARGSGASAYSWVTPRAIQKRNCVSRHFVPASQNGDGRKATTSRSIIGFPPQQRVSKPRLRKNCSRFIPRSSSRIRQRSSLPCNGRVKKPRSCSLGSLTRSDRGMLLPADSTAVVRRDLIVALAAKYRLPAVYPFGYFVPAGGLMAYGIDQNDMFRLAASYVDRICRASGSGADAVRNGTQSQGCEGLGSTSTVRSHCGRRRGDRVKRLMSAFGTKRTSRPR